jgi:hypothetical protein
METGTGAPLPGRQAKKDGDKRKTGRLLFLFLLLLLAILLLLFFQPWVRQPVPIVAGDFFPGSGEAQDGALSSMSQEQIAAQMQKLADASYFSFKINARPEFENGRSKGDLGIENPNYNIYPMVVQIFLDSTGEIIYDSGGILPNQHIDEARLTKSLSAGTHKATAYMNAYDPETHAWQGRQAAELIITVNS